MPSDEDILEAAAGALRGWALPGGASADSWALLVADRARQLLEAWQGDDSDLSDAVDIAARDILGRGQQGSGAGPRGWGDEVGVTYVPGPHLLRSAADALRCARCGTVLGRVTGNMFETVGAATPAGEGTWRLSSPWHVSSLLPLPATIICEAHRSAGAGARCGARTQVGTPDVG